VGHGGAHLGHQRDRPGLPGDADRAREAMAGERRRRGVLELAAELMQRLAELPTE
jgi:hypothetical protein